MAHDSAHLDLPPVTFDTDPTRYHHWKLAVAGPVATLTMQVDRDSPLRPGYDLKMNSYDLGVDIELADAVRRLRFEQPQVRCVVVTGGVPKMFCAGANIKMLAGSAHGFKVNFCKFTNETRCEIEDATNHSGQRYIAALNGTAAGGGYELAEACAEIYLIDDGFSAVSLPEVPLLGVLPGTGGLTRLVDKRKVRRDVADVFCTKAEGFRLRDALKMRLVDGGWPKSKWDQGIADRSQAIVAEAGGASDEQGIALTPLTRTQKRDGETENFIWQHVTLKIFHDKRWCELTIHGPSEPAPGSHGILSKQGATAWSLQAFREFDAALLELRFNFPKIGLILLKTQGDVDAVLAHDSAISRLRVEGSWLAREIQLFQSRVLRRLDNMSRSMFALIEPGSCFAGTLLEMAWSADRAYMLDDPDGKNAIALGHVHAGTHAAHNGMTRLQIRLYGEPGSLQAATARSGLVDAPTAEKMALVTRSPDDIDWEDEVRLAIEERVSFSPDALTGMEQNLRFAGPENCDTKLFGRLTAWQNWIFQRPNAVGERGALPMYGNPQAPVFDWTRT
jgi:benzoyl-CoA-dihydrodiol lyase